MNTYRDDDSNEYLWDRSGPIDPAVADFERALGPLAYRPERHPLRLPEHTPRRRWPVMSAIAASVLVAAGISLFYWRLAWPAGRAWPMAVTTAASAERTAALVVGEPLRLDAASSAAIDVARLGSMHVRPGTALTLSATASAKHLLRLDRGSVRLSVWSPPSRIVFTTPAGDVIDLGCVFTLDVDVGGTAHVSVETGWVQLENTHGEVLVPAGSSTVMTASGQPLVPVFDDATDGFRQAIRDLEAGPAGSLDARLTAVRRGARARDVPTLLVLALRQPEAVRVALLDHAATLAPPPGAPRAGVASLDEAAIWEWFDSLPLPPAKSWWRNWRDGFRK